MAYRQHAHYSDQFSLRDEAWDNGPVDWGRRYVRPWPQRPAVRPFLPEDLAHVSPYLTEHIKRFGEYSTHELAIEPEAYDSKPDVGFTPLREHDVTLIGLGQAA
ncbi:hypothetical protein [Streptomyces sp. NPDC048411]|uniref:hypothetical protein n=1 Tax=Streptomyces sp. NPDC048411 TaxID=3157206 RepID=UPI00345250A2